MPDLSLTQALAELAALKNRVGAPPTIAELRDIVARTRVTQVDPVNKSIDRVVSTKVTLLYSGRLSPGVSSKDIAAAMAQANPELAIINKTHVGELLDIDSPFYNEIRDAALREGLVEGPSSFESFVNGPSGGFWSKASERFTLAGASGDFIVIAPNATGLVDPATGLLRPSSVFGTVELKALLDGGATGRINGIAIEDLRARYTALSQAGSPAAALTDIAELVSVKSASDMWSAVKTVPGENGAAALVKVDAAFFGNNGVAGVGSITSTGYVDGQARFAYNLIGEGPWFTSQTAKTFFSKAAALKALGAAGKVAGPLGDLVELGALAGVVVGKLNAGDREGAARAAATGLASIGGGALAAGAAATYAAPLLAGGPVGWVAYTIVVVGAGVIGSEAGQYVVDKAYTAFSETLPNYYQKTGFNPPIWIADGLGAFHSFVSGTFFDGYEYGARFTRELLNGEIDIVKWFTSDSPTPDVPEIIVTANRRTGQASVSNLPDFLRGDPLFAQELGQALLDFARSGSSFQGGSSNGGGGWGSYAQPSTLAQARAQSSAPVQQKISLPVLRRNDDGTVTIGVTGSEAPGAGETGGLWINNDAIARILGSDGKGGFRIEDLNTSSLIDLKVETVNGVTTTRKLFERSISGKLEVAIEYGADGKTVKNTALRFGSNPKMVTFSDAAGLIGDNLGYRLAGGNRLTGSVYSAFLKTAGQNLGEALDAVVFGSPANIGKNIETVLADIDRELLNNLKSAGVGALSSLLTAELVNAVGLSGFAGEFANSSAGYVIGQLANQLILEGANISEALKSLDWTQLGNAVGGFLGSRLASELVSFDTVGGQIGSAVGSALGTLAMTELAKAGTLLAGPVGAAIGAFVGFIIGGLIGSIFGGTPRSGADSVWDSSQQKFVVANVWSKKGGSKDAARSVASAVSDTFNAVLSATGGTLLNPEAVQSGNYGMRKKAFVYKPYSTRDSDAITQKFLGKDAATHLIGYGVYTGLTDSDFQIAGGNIYVKRALYNTFEIGGLDPRNFDSSALLGNMASAQQYESYLANSGVINALVAAEPESAFAIETLITLARAQELGLTRRAASDWFGGFSFLIREADTTAADVDFGFDYDPVSGQVSRLIGIGNYVLGDAIDIAGQTTIEADSANNTIDLRVGNLADQRGYTVNGHLNDDIAAGDVDFTGLGTSVSFAAGALRATVSVALANDGVAESLERFEASLSDASAMQIMGGAAVATIVDGAAALPTLLVGDSYAWEGDGYAVFRLSLSKAAAEAITVALALVDGKALGTGADYGAAGAGNLQVSLDGVSWTDATSVTFAAGTTELFVRTAVVADNVANPDYVAGGSAPEFLNVEGNERFNLSATVTAGASALANGTQTVSGTGTIIDGAGTEPLVWIDDVIVDEASGQARFVISRSRTMATSTTVGFATSDRRVLDIDIAATVDGGAGDDTIYASNLGDNLFGGAGNDALYGGRLDDWLLGGDGDDILDAGTAGPLALGGDGNYLNGGAGNDILRGREGSDWLEGSDGVDTITGGAGDDILTGGAADGDSLKGGLGNDQYLIRRGDGADIAEDDAAGAPVSNGAGDAITQRMTAIETWKTNPLAAGAIRPDWLGAPAGVQQGAVSGGEDAVAFGTGIDIGDIRMQRSGTSGAPGNDLIIQVMQTDPSTGVESFSGTQLTIKDWFSNPFKRVEWLKFSDGNEVRIGDVTSFIVGGSGDDVLIGTNGNDFVYGGAGNDRLFLLGGDDIGNGASGNDMVAGDAGRDLLIGGTGSDTLIGGAGADAISGDAGADDLYGGADRDILSGGRGDGDIIAGGAGDDTFKFARGDGRDIYFDEFADYWSVVWSSAGDWNTAAGFSYDPATGVVTGPGGVVLRQNFGTAEKPDFQWVGRYDYDAATGTLKVFNPPAGVAITANAGVDTIEFAPGINLQDVILRQNGDDLVLAVSRDDLEVADLGAVADSVTIKDWYRSPGQIEKLAFYATGILDIAPGTTNLVAGTDGADGTLTTPLAGTVIADWITAGAGDDVVAGGSGNDIIAGNSGSDTLRGEGGDDVIYGGTGNDSLDGGSGKDILVGGSGIDTASYASAAAAVRVRLSMSSNNLGDAAGDEYDSIENVIGGAAADDIGGDEGDNELDGGSGADLLMGGAGDDTYIWSPTSGTDTIREGDFTVEEAVTTAGVLADGYTATWTNTGTPSSGGKYYWRLEIRGPGNELVYDYAQYSYAAGTAMPAPAAWNSAGWLGGFAKTNGQQVTRDKFDTTISGGDQDAIEFAAGISLTDLTFIRASGGVPNATGSDLIIRYGGSSATQLTIKDHFTVYGRVETLQFNDGLAVSLASILSATSGAALNGTADADLIVGQTGVAVDLLNGGAGDDALSGLEGDDQLYGEDGDDVLEGGAGADRLDGGANANAADSTGDTVRYVKSAAVTIDLGITTAQSGGDAEGDTLFGIENVVGSQTGSDTIIGDAGANIIDALDGNNLVDGKGGNDVLIAGSGNDLLYGGAGEDNLTAGEGDDQLWGGTENDILVGGAGIDQLRGEDGNDKLLGGDGNDSVLDGGASDDEIYGEAGDDMLTGGDGNDLLAGGAGNDLLQGGAGDDRYFVEARGGADRIVDTAGTNIISFDKDVSYDRLWLTRVGSDLKIGVIGDDTVVTVADFFAAVSPGKIRSIQTTTHAIFLDHPDTLNLITAMTAASASVPASVPTAIADTLKRYWHKGGKAAPIVPTTPRAVSTNEDSAIAIDGNYGVIDHDNNITGYQLKGGAGPAKGVVSNFNPATGALTYTPNADATGSDSFIVIVTDSDGHAVELPVSVSIAPVNDAPRALAIKGGGSLVVAESASGSILAAGTIVGEFESLDIEGDALTYSLVNDADARFAMTADGKLIVSNPGAINFEAAASHSVRVRVTDANGAYSEQDFVVAVENRNEANSLPASYSMSVAENVAIGTVVGSVAASDLDQAGPFASQRYYFWDGSTASATSSDGRYAIDATTGQITVNGALDFEAASPSKAYLVVARDNSGASGYNQAVTTVTIGIADVNEANSLPASYGMTVNENVAVGTVVGTVAAADTDTAGSIFAQQRYYFWNGSAVSSVSSDGRYAIDALTGQITTNAALDFEAGTASVTYQVVARDNEGGAGYFQTQTAVTIEIANLNEANNLPAAYSMAVNENVAAGTVVGIVAATDLDQTGAFASQRYYFWDGATAASTSVDGRYAIDALTGQISVNSALNFEGGNPSKIYQVIARDNAGAPGYHQAQADVTIAIGDVNEAPISLNWSPLVTDVTERDRVGSGETKPAIALGTLAVTDPDTAGLPNASYSFAVADTRFEIIGNTLRLKEGASFDFEAGASVTVDITATDQTGTPFTITRMITIVVADRDDVLEGTSGGDTLTGQSGRDLIYGFGGNDVVQGGEGHDVIEGGDGDDILRGDNGADRILGGAGDDYIEGGEGDDYGIWYTGTADGGLFGGAGNDTIVGGTGVDLAYGEEGDDLFVIDEDGGNIWDRFDGGAGWDTITYANFSAGVSIDLTIKPFPEEPQTAYQYGDLFTNIEDIIGSAFADSLAGNEVANRIYGMLGNDTLSGGLGDDMLDGGQGNDTLHGGDGADTLIGGAGDDVIYGGAGNDVLLGGAGNDQLFAEAGDDLLDGGEGNDVLNGGIDNDTYIVNRTSGADLIQNYDPSGDDVDVIGFQDAMGAINDQDLWFERIGDDLKISVIGTTSSVQIVNWYVVADATSRANHKIDFIVAGERFSRTINIEALASLMATKAKPTTTAERDTLMADLTYRANWATHWGTNAAPALSAIAVQSTNEDSGKLIWVTATDDITPNAQIQLSAQVISGTNVVTNAGITFGAADANGVRAMTINPVANASGIARIRVTAVDAGGVSSTQEFDITVSGIADTPTITQFTSAGGTSGYAGGIALNLGASFPDIDGSETHEIWITGIPAGVSLSAGSYDSASATWKLTSAQITNLKVHAPAGWSQDLSLSVTARASENGQTVMSAPVNLKLVINTAPTGVAIRGLDWSASLSVNEYTPSNNPAGKAVGTAAVIDPDSLDRNLLPADLSQLPLRGIGEERIVTTTGPSGGTVQAVETGQNGAEGDPHGGGLPWLNVGAADTSKAYKFTIYFKPENNMGHQLYFGTYGNIENAWDGQADGNPYFYYGNSSGFVQDRWYRVEGYVLPSGTALIGNETFGGVFDTVTGQKVANTFTYRFGAGASDTGARFFSFYNQTNAGYSAQWYQPTIEKLDYSYQLLDSAGGRFAINSVTGLITATGANLDYEAATSHNITVRVTDSFGEYRDQTIAVSVNNLNETNAITTSYSFYLDENRSAGTYVGSVAASDIDSASNAFGQQRYYFWNGTTAQSTSFDGRFTIDAVSGTITSNTAFNWEADPHTNHRVIARDNAGGAGFNQVETTVYIYLNNVNEQNSLPSSYSFSVAENLGAGTYVGTITASDPDIVGVSGAFAEQRYYFWDGSSASSLSWDGRYQINVTTGVITTNQVFDYEAGSQSRNYTVIARDNQGSGAYKQAATTVTLGIANLNETPNAPNGGATVWSFFDETGLGSKPANAYVSVAAFPMSDPDGTTPTLQFVENPNNWFYIDGNVVRFNPGLDFNFEWARSAGYSIYDWNGDGRLDAHVANVYVRASDGSLASGSTLLQVFISDVNERPNNLSLTSQTLYTETTGSESHAGQVIANFAMSDPDQTTPGLVIVGGNQNGWFTTNGAGQLQFAGANFTADWIRGNRGSYGTDAGFYYDTDGDGYMEIRVATLTLKARDGAGAESDSFTYNVYIEDKNETPTDIWADRTLSFSENIGVGVGLAWFGGSDPDNNIASYSLINDAGGRFALRGDGLLMVGSTGFNYEAGANHWITVRVTDVRGAIYDESFLVALVDQNEAHTLANISASRAEGQYSPYPAIDDPNAYLNLRAMMLSDPDVGAPMNWSFADGSYTSGIWSIEGSTGRLYLTSGSVDYEALTTYYETYYDYDPNTGEPIEYTYAVRDPSLATQNLSIKASDGVYSATATLTVSVTDVNEAPSVGSYSTYYGSDGKVIYRGAYDYWVTADKNGGSIIQITAADPEGQGGFTYSITDQNAVESIWGWGGSSEIDSYALPYVYISSTGTISFTSPGEGNGGEWEGGTKIGGTRRTSTVYVTFNLNVTDASGMTKTTPFAVTFIRRGSSVPPIVLDLDGDGLELVPLEGSTVQFDMDGDGQRDTTGWAGADDGFLALDRNGNGLIDDIAEISFIGDTEGAVSDLEGLRAYDSDGDGYFDDGDVEFGRFLIWRDANQDGVSQAYEMKTLAEWGIRAINLSMSLTGQQAAQADNFIYSTTEYERADGTTGTVGDVFLAFEPEEIEDIAPPIVLDFDGDGKSLTEMADNKVRFDMNGDGIADKTGWIEQGDAFLALDRNGNGKIDDLSEISFVADKAGAKTDLEGLAAFDSNSDGMLSGSDARFAEFRLWFDNNANGVTDAGELLSLAQAGVTSISLAGVATGEQAVSGKNIVYNTGGFTRANGETGKLLDVGLGFKPLSVFPEIEFQKSDWQGKAKSYRLTASGGTVRVVPREVRGVLSADAGQIADAAALSFGDGTISMLSAILVDLDGDGLEAKKAGKSKAWFDMNADGVRDDTGWMSGGDGMLVIDRDKDGAITQASEFSFVSEKEGAKNSWEGLAGLDSNKDGKLDKTDTRFGELKVWADRNGDGISQDGEIKSLLELGIAEIGLRNLATSDSVKVGQNLALSTATYKRENGTTATIGNVALGFTASRAGSLNPVDPEDGPQVLPIDAARAASNLAQAMSRFGADASESDLRNAPRDGMAPHDWFAAAVA